jgi:uncharacterized protein (DUF58 family)
MKPPPLPYSARRTAMPPPLPRTMATAPRLRSAVLPLLPPTKPVDLELLAKLPSMSWRACYLMEGFLSGEHRSPRKGYSVEFAEYRAYQPGDELRRVDWRLFGRSDRLYLKRYEEHTQLKAHLVLDVSASMSYVSRPGILTKLDYARMILAGIALLMQRDGDPVGLALAGDGLEDYLRPRCSTGHLHALFGKLDSVPKGSQTNLGAALSKLAALLSKRNLVIIAGDFYEDAATLLPALRRLRHDKHEVVALQVLDPAEVDFDFEASGNFVDLESRMVLPLHSGAARDRYLKKFRTFLAETEEMFRGHGADYVLLRTDESPVRALAAYFAKRESTL